MSEFNDIKNLWKSADSQILTNESLDVETVKQAISKQSTQITSKLLMSFRFGILALILNVVLCSINIYGYADNKLIVTFFISSLILSIVLILFLVYQQKRINQLDQAGLTMQDLIVAKIKYSGQSLSYVHHAIAIGVVLLAFSLSLLVDNNDGHYQINNIWLFIAVMTAVYLIQILSLNLSHKIYLKQYKIALHDLNQSRLTEMNTVLKKYKWVKMFFLIIILLSFIAGIIIFFLKIGGH